MIDIKRLLQFTPDEAILMIANDKLNTYLRPEIVKVGTVTALQGLRTRVTIESTDVHPEMIQNPYEGVSELVYNRYDLTSTFDVILSNISTPTTTQSLLDQISEATGIVFTDEDFSNERIDDSEYWLTPLPGSKRWVGAVKVIFDSDTLGTHISQYLPINEHEGLVSEPKDYIWNVFPNDILDGLDRGKPDIGVYLRNNDHDGLTKDERLGISLYLTVNDHDGLTKDDKSDISVYVPIADHKGLKYIRRYGYDLQTTPEPEPEVQGNTDPLDFGGYEF